MRSSNTVHITVIAANPQKRGISSYNHDPVANSAAYTPRLAKAMDDMPRGTDHTTLFSESAGAHFRHPGPPGLTLSTNRFRVASDSAGVSSVPINQTNVVNSVPQRSFS